MPAAGEGRERVHIPALLGLGGWCKGMEEQNRRARRPRRGRESRVVLLRERGSGVRSKRMICVAVCPVTSSLSQFQPSSSAPLPHLGS